MSETDDQRAMLHTRLEQSCDEKRERLVAALDQLEDERLQAHGWIDSAPDVVILALLETGGIPLVHDPLRPSPNMEEGRIQLYKPITDIIESIDPQHMVTSAIIHDALLQRIPALRLESERKLKARIASTLSRLTEEGTLKLARQGGGSAPHKYKIVKSPYRSVVESVRRGVTAKK